MMNLPARIERFGPEHATKLPPHIHPDLRALRGIANPPFNDSDGPARTTTVRLQYAYPEGPTPTSPGAALHPPPGPAAWPARALGQRQH